MEALLIYFAKVLLSSTVLFAYYHLMLRERTFHHYNRFYLLGIVVISLLLPLLKLSYFTLEVNDDIYLLLNNLQNFKSTNALNYDNLYFGIIASVCGVVSVLLLVRFILGILKVERLKREFTKDDFEGFSFYQTNLENAPFSFFKNLFWKNTILLNSDLGRQILKHEMVHIEQKHSFDKVFIEVVIGIFWFNPVFWMIKKEINLIHEYLADKKAVRKSDTKAFAQMILASHFSGNILPATNPFLNSNLKKRLKMLQKSKTKFGYFRKILVLPLLFAIGFIYMVNAKNKKIETTNKIVDKMVENYMNEIEESHSKQVKLSIMKKVEVFSATENMRQKEAIIKDSLKKIGPFDAMIVYLYAATDKNSFIISGKDASKKEFVNFYLKNKENPSYDFGSLGINPMEYESKGKLAIFTADKKGEYEKSINLVKEIIEKNKKNIINTEDLKNNVAFEKINNVYKSPYSEHEFEAFFKKSKADHDKKLELIKKHKAELTKDIKEKMAASKINESFYKDRDYDQQPLTKEEIQSLKKEAAEIEEMHNKLKENKKKDDYFGYFFKVDEINRISYDTSGKISKNEVEKKYKMINFPVVNKEVTFIVNGKNVNKEKFLENISSVEDSESFIKKDSKIKTFKIISVGDGVISFPMRLEIITKK